MLHYGGPMGSPPSSGLTLPAAAVNHPPVSRCIAALVGLVAVGGCIDAASGPKDCTNEAQCLRDYRDAIAHVTECSDPRRSGGGPISSTKALEEDGCNRARGERARAERALYRFRLEKKSAVPSDSQGYEVPPMPGDAPPKM